MKEVVLLLCATICYVNGGAVAWPGAIPLSAAVRTVIPPQVKGFAYSTSQYINAVPSYSVGYQPQVSYQVPQLGVYPNYPGISFQPILAPSYYPGASPVYPGLSPIAPPMTVAPSPPPQSAPASPNQDVAGDEDTAVVDSAEFPSDQRGQTQPDAAQGYQTTSNTGSYDSKNMPAFPQIQSPQTPQISGAPEIPQPPSIPQIPQRPDIPQIPSIPQIPQRPDIPQIPSIPQIPQYPGFLQFPQFSQPQLFQPNPSYPQAPSVSQPSESQFGFPSQSTGPQSLSDEDSIAVDSA